MKIINFLIIILLSGCNVPKNQDLKIILKSRNIIEKPVTSKVYIRGDWTFGNTLFINSDSTYCEEFDHGWYSEICVGKWSIISDSIILTPTSIDSFTMISHVHLGKIGNLHRQLTLRILDKEHMPVEGFTLLNYNSTKSVAKGKPSAYYETNSRGLVTLDYSKYDSIYFPKLINQEVKIKAINLPDTIALILNVNRDLFRLC